MELGALGNIEIKGLVRPCMNGERKALFHGWYPRTEIIPPSNLRGGHNGGQITTTVGVVEWDNGTTHLAYPGDIRFLDTDRQMEEFQADFYREEIRNTDLPEHLKPVYEELLKGLDGSAITEE